MGNKRFFLVALCFLLLTVSASSETVMESVCDHPDTIETVGEVRLVADSVVDHSGVAADSVVQKKTGWFSRALNGINKVLSPTRDSAYIDVQNYNWCAMAQMSSRFELYDIDSGDDFYLQVSPATWRTRVGPFFGWRWAFFGYNIDLKSIFMNSKDTDLGASIYSAAFGVDLFYRKVGGEYIIKKLEVGNVDYSSYLHAEPFSGINIGMTRISLYYIFNYKHYSHQAAFSQTNRQLRSAGSPIAGFSYSHNRLNVDWDELRNTIYRLNPNAERQATDDVTMLDFETQSNNEFSLTGGYAYNWVFAKNFLAASELTGSVGYLRHRSTISNSEKEVNKDEQNILAKIDNFYRKNIALNGNMRLALLYNNGPWFAGAQAVVFFYQYGNGNIMTRNTLGSLYFYIGFNF